MNFINKFTSNKVAGIFAGLIFCASIAVIVSNPPVMEKAHAQTVPVGIGGVSGIFLVNSSDPCESPTAAKISAAVTITTATSTEIFPAVPGKTTYVCGAKLGFAGAQTLVFETGTVTPCGSPVAKTGTFAIAAASNPVEFLTPPINAFQSAKGGDVCLVSTTTAATTGIITAAVQ